MTCKKCGFQSGGSANFCQECGSSITNECDDCGIELPATAKFCLGCGASQIPSNTPILPPDDSIITFTSCPPHSIDLDENMWFKPNAEVGDVESIWEYALTIDGHATASEKFRFDFMQFQKWWVEKYSYYDRTGFWEGSFEELRLCLFFFQRNERAVNPGQTEGETLMAVQALYLTIAKRWEIEKSDSDPE